MPEEPSNLPVAQPVTVELKPENYDEDIEAINKELKDVEELYQTSKTELDRVRASRARGSLSFTHMQTANLISLKSQKLSLIKARQAIKKDRFKQSMQMQMLNGGNELEIPAYKVLEVLAMNNMSYETLQKSKEPKKISEAEEADFEELVAAELEGDTKPVTTAENELPEFASPVYEPPKPAEDESDKCTEEEVFVPKTEVYEVVCDPNGKLYIVDVENSTVENTEFFEPDLLGITPDERAEIKTSDDGLQTATFRGAEIEIVQIEEGTSDAKS